MKADLKIEMGLSLNSNNINSEKPKLDTHLSVRVRDELEGLHGESQDLVCARDELRGSWVPLAIQHTATDGNKMILDSVNCGSEHQGQNRSVYNTYPKLSMIVYLREEPLDGAA